MFDSSNDIVNNILKNRAYCKIQIQKMTSSRVIQLVGIQQSTKKLYITPEGKQFLQEINTPISVVTIAGLYRTGKSYLVNELLMLLHKREKLKSCQNEQFLVGNSIQSCTKGLNVWAMPFNVKQERQFCYIVIDSEGIGSMEQEHNYDVHLLMLIFLISSTVIYNSVGAIDEQSLDQLRVVVNLQKCLSGSPSHTQPRLIWVLRDFALQLINKYGKPLTPNQYLQDCLQLTQSLSKQTIKKNQIRKAIKQHLPSRQCHTLVRPTINENQLSCLKDMPKHKLRKQFVEQVQELFGSVFRNDFRDVKTLGEEGNWVDGPSLGKMIQYYLGQINCDKVPEIKSVWELIQSTKFEELMEECQNKFKRQILKIDLPLQDQQLKSRLNQIQTTIFSQYESYLRPSTLNEYKRYNKQFSKLSQSMNEKMFKANKQIKRKKNLKKIRDIMNKEIQFDKVDPLSMLKIKSTVEQLELKKIGQIQAYEYVIGTIFDVMEIAQKKMENTKKELEEIKERNEENNVQNQSREEQFLKLKISYHEALKQISMLKSSHVQNQKDLAVKNQQLILLESKYSSLMKQKVEKEEELRRKIEEINEKSKKRNQQNTQSLRSLRQENNSLINELNQARKQINQKISRQRKQVIFQDKIKHSWDRFEQERAYLKKQLENFKQLYFESEQKFRFIKDKEQKLQAQLRKQRQSCIKKQKQFCQQLRWMKQNYSKTKEAYNQSMNTKIENQRILQDVTQGSRRRNLLTTNENTNTALKANDKAALDLLNSDYQKLKSQKQALVNELNVLRNKCEKSKSQEAQLRNYYEKRLQKLEEHTKMLQESNQAQKQRFYSCLKQLQKAKQSQRQMYEDSIMRLLNNIEKSDLSSTKNKFSQKGVFLGKSSNKFKRF